MDAIDAKAAKVIKMHEYIEKCRAELSATEDAEFAKRIRQYWSASKSKQKYLDEIKELEEETQKSIEANAKINNVIFITALLAGIAIHYLNLIDKGNQTILGVGFFAYFAVREMSSQLDSANYTTKRASSNEQVDFYKHEMSCSGGGQVDYEDEYLNFQNNDDAESKKVIRELYFSSVEIAILHGLKSKMQFKIF